MPGWESPPSLPRGPVPHAACCGGVFPCGLPEALPTPTLLGEYLMDQEKSVLFHHHCLRQPGGVWTRQHLRVGEGWRGGVVAGTQGAGSGGGISRTEVHPALQQMCGFTAAKQVWGRGSKT